MHIAPIDMNVPEDQKYRAMRTQITQQVKRLGCACFVAFEEKKMRQWIGKHGDKKQAWVTVIDNDEPGPSDEKIFAIFFAKHEDNCKWKGKGEMMLNPIRTEKRRGELKTEIRKRTNGETELQGCGCEIDIGTLADLETEMLMNQGRIHVKVSEEPEEEEEGMEDSQWAEGKNTLQVQATQDRHDTQSQALPRSKSFTGPRKARKGQTEKQQDLQPFQTPPEETELGAAMKYVIKTMTGVAARINQMYRGYLDRVEGFQAK